MSEALVLKQKAEACRMLMRVAFDVVVFELLKERAEEYESKAAEMRKRLEL